MTRESDQLLADVKRFNALLVEIKRFRSERGGKVLGMNYAATTTLDSAIGDLGRTQSQLQAQLGALLVKEALNARKSESG